MGEVLTLANLPWLWLQPYLSHSEPLNPTLEMVGSFSHTGQVINYKKFLARYRINLSASMMQKWDDLLVHEVMRKLYQYNKEKGHPVDVIFDHLSSSRDKIPKQEFVRALSGIIPPSPPPTLQNTTNLSLSLSLLYNRLRT